jgi:hypothetical protein
MAPRGKAAKIVKSSKISKRKLRSTSTSADDSDSDFNLESSSDAVASKRRRARGRGISLSKTITHCVTKPSIKATRSMKTGVQAASAAPADEPMESEEVPYWQRRRPLNPSTQYEEPTAKQVADAAADWSRGQRDSRFPEFEPYNLVTQDPTENDMIMHLSEERTSAWATFNSCFKNDTKIQSTRLETFTRRSSSSNMTCRQTKSNTTHTQQLSRTARYVLLVCGLSLR